MIHIPEKVFSLEDDLSHYISDDEWMYIEKKNNKPNALIHLQSRHLRQLKERGLIWEFSFLELENVLAEFLELQGKSERIKNFPYPRQYATLSYYFVWIFILLLPFATIPLFANFGSELSETFPLISKYFVWASIPFCAMLSWVFHTMERIGRVGENPFEGTANDVPISTIARGIEIDMRQMLDEDEDEIPKQFPEEYDVQM
jgi:putative membrane protein